MATPQARYHILNSEQKYGVGQLQVVVIVVTVTIEILPLLLSFTDFSFSLLGGKFCREKRKEKPCSHCSVNPEISHLKI